MSIMVCELIWLHIIISAGEQIDYLCIFFYWYLTTFYIGSWNCGDDKSGLKIIQSYTVLIRIYK